MAITTINGRTMGTTIKEIPSPDRTFLFTGSVDDLPDKGAEGDMAYCLGGADAGKVFRFSEDVLDWVQVESGGGAIYLTQDENQTLSMTYRDIEAAIESGSVVYLKLIQNWGEGQIETNFCPCNSLFELPSGFAISFRFAQGIYNYIAATKNDYPVFDSTPS